jgi:hypothetical protein
MDGQGMSDTSATWTGTATCELCAEEIVYSSTSITMAGRMIDRTLALAVHRTLSCVPI